MGRCQETTRAGTQCTRDATLTIASGHAWCSQHVPCGLAVVRAVRVRRAVVVARVAPAVDTEAAAVVIEPCPFCGSTNTHIDDCGDDVFRKVACECGASGPVRGSEDWDDEHGHDYAAAAERDAIESWNSACGRRTTRGRRVAAHGKGA